MVKQTFLFCLSTKYLNKNEVIVVKIWIYTIFITHIGGKETDKAKL